MERYLRNQNKMVSASQKISFHQPERTNCWEIYTRQKKSFNYQEYLKNQKKLFSTCQNEGFASKICFQQTRKNLSLSGMPRNQIKNSFNYPENLFPLTGIAGVSENNRKKWFWQDRKSVTSSKNKVAFQKLDFLVSTSRKQNL